MRIDYEYLKNLLVAFEDQKKPFPLISDIHESGIEIDRNFAFHMSILSDQGFVKYLNNKGTDPFEADVHDPDGFSWWDCNIRLTAQGYEFLAALKQQGVLEAIKEEIKESSIETVWKVAQGVATKIAAQKLQKYIEWDTEK